MILTIAESASSETGVAISVNPLGLGLEDSWRSSISEMSGNGALSRINEYCICPELALVGGTKHVRVVASTATQGDCMEGEVAGGYTCTDRYRVGDRVNSHSLHSRPVEDSERHLNCCQ